MVYNNHGQNNNHATQMNGGVTFLDLAGAPMIYNNGKGAVNDNSSIQHNGGVTFQDLGIYSSNTLNNIHNTVNNAHFMDLAGAPPMIYNNGKGAVNDNTSVQHNGGVTFQDLYIAQENINHENNYNYGLQNLQNIGQENINHENNFNFQDLGAMIYNNHGKNNNNSQQMNGGVTF